MAWIYSLVYHRYLYNKYRSNKSKYFENVMSIECNDNLSTKTEIFQAIIRLIFLNFYKITKIAVNDD